MRGLEHRTRRHAISPRLVIVALVAALVGVLVPGGQALARQDTPTAPPETPAETPEPVVAPAGLESPADTFETFIVAMSSGDVARAIECLDLADVTRDGAEYCADAIYRCINRLQLVDFGDPMWFDLGVDSIGDRTAWTYFPLDQDAGRPLWLDERQRFERVQRAAPSGLIALTKADSGAWLFSASTVAGSRAFWEQVRQAKIPRVAGLTAEEQLRVWERIEGLWPAPFVEGTFLTVKYWQWITMLGVILVGVLLDFTVRFVLATISRRAIARRGGSATSETLKRTVRPFGLASAALLWLLAFRILGLPDPALKILVPAVRLFAMLAFVWSAYRLTDLLGEVAASKASSTSTRFDDLLIPLVRKALKVFITVFGLIYIAATFSVPLAPLLTGLGIGGAGFAFAAKDTLEHLFGSVTVIADRPFEVGDWVADRRRDGGHSRRAGLPLDAHPHVLQLARSPMPERRRSSGPTVDNYGRRKYRRWKHAPQSCTYDTPPEKLIEAFTEGIRETGQAPTPTPARTTTRSGSTSSVRIASTCCCTCSSRRPSGTPSCASVTG